MADNAPSTQQLEQALTYGAIGFGALASVLPRVFTGIYGLGGDARTTALARTWGTRTAALGGVLALTQEPELKRKVTMIATAMNAFDALVVIRNGRLPARTRVLGALSSGSFAAAGGYLLTQG